MCGNLWEVCLSGANKTLRLKTKIGLVSEALM